MLETRKEEALAEVQTSREKWEQDKTTWEAEQKEREEAKQKKRERQKEEYEYRFRREKQQMQDELADERARMERELALKRVELEQDLSQRETVVAERERELDGLKSKVEAIPTGVQSAVAAAVAETTARLEAQARSREEFLTKEFDGELKVFSTRIQSLEKRSRNKVSKSTAWSSR